MLLVVGAHLVRLLADGSEKAVKGRRERIIKVKNAAEISDPLPLIDFICSVDEDRMHLSVKCYRQKMQYSYANKCEMRG